MVSELDGGVGAILGKLEAHVIVRGVEGHETVTGDVDLDFCSKPWNSDRHVMWKICASKFVADTVHLPLSGFILLLR